MHQLFGKKNITRNKIINFLLFADELVTTAFAKNTVQIAL